jgi:hypothetical protein
MGVAPLSSNFVLQQRGSASVSWSLGNWSANCTDNYVGEFESSTTAPSALNPTGSGIDGAKIAAALAFDVQVSYAIPYRQSETSRWKKLMGGTKWSLGAFNVLDKEPAL